MSSMFRLSAVIVWETFSICNIMWGNLQWAACHILYKSATSSRFSQTSCNVRSNTPPTQKSTNTLCWPLRFSENSDKSNSILLSLLSFSCHSNQHFQTAQATRRVLDTNGVAPLLRFCGIPNDNILIALTQLQAKWPGSKLIFTVSWVHA